MRITGRQLRQIIKEEVARMMNEEDGAPTSGGYAKGSGLEGLYAAELAKMGIDKSAIGSPGSRIGALPQNSTPYTDAAKELVRGPGSVDDAVADLQRLIPNRNPQFYSTLKNNVSSLIYNKGNGPRFREQLQRQFEAPPSEISEPTKAAFAIALLGNGTAEIVSAGFGGAPQMYATTKANIDAIGALTAKSLIPGQAKNFDDVFNASSKIRYFYENLVDLVNAPFPG
jgi:hypothetical protein